MTPQTTSRRNLYILAFTLVVVMLGYGMVIPIIPFYVESMGAGGSELGLLVASYAFMRLIFGPVWGVVSDRVGRKPVLMIGVFGYAVAMFFFAISTQLWMLFAARILSGLLSSATSPTTMAYISDSTSEEDRGGGMGVLGAAVGLGTILGPGLGGLLSGNSLARPFFLAAALSVVAVVLIYALLPESLPAEARRPPERRTGGFSPRALWQVMASPLGILLFLAFLLTCGTTVFFGIFGLYALEQFGYGPQEVGMILMVMGLVMAIAQGALSGPLTRRWGERAVITANLLLSAVGFLLMMLSGSFVTLLLSIGFFVLTATLAAPALSALTSKLTTMEQGLTMGLSNSAMSLGRIAGPIWGGVALDLNMTLPFWSGAVIMFAGFVMSLLWLGRQPQPAAGASLRPSGS